MTLISTPAQIEESRRIATQKVRNTGKSILHYMRSLHPMLWLCLLAACLGTTWFSYQLFLIPQTMSFAPNWGDAQWVQAADGITPTAYFRDTTTISALPDSAFVTIAADQVFRLYVNETYIGSNSLDFLHGDFPRAYMYDVSSALHEGPNVVAIRVANLDQQIPSLHASFGMVYSDRLQQYVTNNSWLATTNSALAHPRYAPRMTSWASVDFDASSWIPAKMVPKAPISPQLTVNPQLYIRPLATHWLSAGYGPEAYFVRRLSVPLGTTSAWLRVAATGTASIYINGHLFIVWNGQPQVAHQNLDTYLSDNGNVPQYRAGLGLGVYNISPYLLPGVNTIAIHVLAPGVSGAQVGLDNLSSAMSMDVLFGDITNHSTWLTSESSWHVSTKYASNWTLGDEIGSWAPATLVGRPGAVRSFYISEDVTPRNVQISPFILLFQIAFLSIIAVIGPWLLMSFWGQRRYYRSFKDALETMSLAYVPALAVEGLLVALSREPQIVKPFPYTWAWALLLLLLVIVSYLFLWLRGQKIHHELQNTQMPQAISVKIAAVFAKVSPLRTGLLKPYSEQPTSILTALRHSKFSAWLRMHWPIVLLFLVSVPLVCYNLGYEPYWQDEISSYFAAKGILEHGLPFFPSGYLYSKAELYSYMLALWTLLTGTQGGIPRAISAVEYLISIPVCYYVGCYFFKRHIALLGTAMLALSPVSLVWSRQMRMYEQAQLFTLLSVFLFYKAIQERTKVRYVYLAAASLALMYLSHEETFITLPAIVLCIFLASKEPKRLLPWVFYEKHWWFAALLCGSVIGGELLVVRFSHVAALGTDQTQRPFVQFTTDNIPYYFNLLFNPSALGNGTSAWLTLNSCLAALGCIWARRSSDIRIKYCALFPVISLITLTFLFTAQADRYIYTFLPFYYLIGAYAMFVILRSIWTFACLRTATQKAERGDVRVAGGYIAGPMRIAAYCVSALLCIAILISPILPLSGYNLFMSRVLGFSYHRHYPDYDAAGQYMQQHWKKGDIVITVGPANTILYYTGHGDYFFSVDRALFLLEQNGHLVETASGSHAMLNQDDLQTVLSTYPRIWIISDNGSYQAEINKRFVFPADFHLVFEGYGSAVYFRGD